jgi:hypothetical protein
MEVAFKSHINRQVFLKIACENAITISFRNQFVECNDLKLADLFRSMQTEAHSEALT